MTEGIWGAWAYAGRSASARSRGDWATRACCAGLALGLAIGYWGPWQPLRLAGLLLFGALALLRPELALLFVPLTLPLFLTQLNLPGEPDRNLPPHELALLSVAAALILRWAWMLVSTSRVHSLRCLVFGLRSSVLRAHQPEVLFALAGGLALLLGAPEPEARSAALRAFRWFVVEPLLFAWLLHRLAARHTAGTHTLDEPLQRLLVAFVAGATLAAAGALLEFVCALLAPQLWVRLLPGAAGSDMYGGILRVTSVYGNPNNLGLALGRAWPLAAALALLAWRASRRRTAIGYALCALACLGGIFVSFSRGAWMGAGAALLVLLLPQIWRRFAGRILPAAIVVGVTLALVATLIVALRGGFAGGSSDVRLLFWRESLELLERHPLGLGLDQFFYYHNPAYQRSLIDPALLGAGDQDARQPHNLVLELWLNFGPLGLLAMAWLLLRCARSVVASLRAALDAPATLLALGAAAALAAALVHGLVDTFYFWPDLALGFWLLLALPEVGARAQEAGRTAG